MQSARVHFEKALALDPNHALAHSRLAYLVFRRLDYARAETEAQTAARLDPADSVSYIILGRALEARGETDKARAAYTAAVDLASKATTQERLLASALAYYLRAMQRIQKGETTDVESDLKEVIRLYPKNAYALYEHGLFLLRSGRAAEAVETLQRASDAAATFQPQESWIYPNRRYLFLDSNLHFWRGAALREAGRLDEALAELEPLLPKAESLQGSETRNQNSAAFAALEGKVDTSFYGAHYEAALAYDAKGDRSRALALVKALLKLNMADADTLRRGRDLQKRLK